MKNKFDLSAYKFSARLLVVHCETFEYNQKPKSFNDEYISIGLSWQKELRVM